MIDDTKRRHNELDINYHNAIADEYESVINEPRKVSNDILFKPLLNHIPKKIDVYLDLGCGTGQMVERVGRQIKPKQTWAVDHSDAMLSHAKKCADLLSIPNFHAVNGDILTFLDKPPTKFSLISAVGVIHHLMPSQVPDLLTACYDSLSKDGMLLLAEPVDVASLNNTPKKVSQWNETSAFKGRGYSLSAEEPDEHPLKEGWLEQQLEAASFKIIKINKGIELFPHNNPATLKDKLMIKFMQKKYGRDGFVVAWLAQKV